MAERRMLLFLKWLVKQEEPAVQGCDWLNRGKIIHIFEDLKIVILPGAATPGVSELLNEELYSSPMKEQ